MPIKIIKNTIIKIIDANLFFEGGGGVGVCSISDC